MFFVCLFLSFIIVIALLFKHGRSRHKGLVTLTIFMIMAGITCWAYHDVNLQAGYYSNAYNSNAFSAVINQPIIWTIGMILLILSVPCTLFCMLSKPKKIEEIDKLLEDQDDID